MKTYTKHEIAMKGLIREYIDVWVGGYENTILDFPEGTPERKEAEDFLYRTPAATLLEWFYDEVMSNCKAGSNAEHARFAGSEFLRAQLGVYIIKNNLGKEFNPQYN